MKKYLLEANNMTEKIKNWVNICVLKNQEILLLNRQHDNFPGWIPPGGKVEFPESFFEAALRELKEETGLTALNLELKGISGFTNSIGNERFVFYDFLCTQFTGELSTSDEGEPIRNALAKIKQFYLTNILYSIIKCKILNPLVIFV